MEKRAEITNGHHNASLCCHSCGTPGSGRAHLLLTLPAIRPVPGPSFRGPRQSAALTRSRILAKAVVGELQKKKLQVGRLNAPLRPLNNIITPAIAVEFAPKRSGPRSPESLKTQNAVAAAVAAGILLLSWTDGNTSVIPRHFQIMISVLLRAILTGRHLHHPVTAWGAGIFAAGAAAPVFRRLGGSLESIHILVAYDDDQALRWRDAETFMPVDRSLRARAVLRAVLEQYLQKPSPHPVGKGAAIKDVYFIGNDTLLVDTTAAFADEHPSGILLEEMTLASLIETLSANVPGITQGEISGGGQGTGNAGWTCRPDVVLSG